MYGMYNNYISENCSFVYLGGSFYNIDASVNSTIVNMSVPGSNGMMGMPSNSIPSSSMQYMFTYNVLYKFSPSSNEYVAIYNLPYFSQCNFFNYQNRIVISCAGSMYNYNMMGMYYTISQSIYVLRDNNGIVEVLDVINFETISSSYSYGNLLVPIVTSPELTKIYYQYSPYGSTTPTIVFKNIDYVNLYVYDVTFIDQQRFIDTTFKFTSTNTSLISNISNASISIGQGNFKLGDRFVLLRNDTQFSLNSTLNITNSSSNPEVYVEEGYEFVGNALVFVNSRILTTA